MKAYECVRKLEIAKPADEVWGWLSDVRNAMTADQFHEAIEFDEPVRGPGPVVPIRHNIFGRRFLKLGRITKYETNHIAWGERQAPGYGPENFPHSVAYWVRPGQASSCTVVTRVRGTWQAPLARLIGPYVWSQMLPPVLDADLADVAFGVGAIREKPAFVLPPQVPALMRLMHARTVDSAPAEELVASLL
ncbi:MAG: hypothetical protein JOZ39_11115 [Chloroflexi bacterium]|nr:hypothetical protein [Chloroflexota bacterium]